MTDDIPSLESPFVCDMNGIAPAYRQQHIATTFEVFQAVEAVNELPNGYAFRLPNETSLLMKTIEFIANERLCCSFFGFTVEVGPAGMPLWLHITGPDGVKPFIQAELGKALNEAVAQSVGFS